MSRQAFDSETNSLDEHVDSTTALILINEADTPAPDLPIPDEYEDDGSDLGLSNHAEPLTSSAALLYLLSPFLRLGALSLPFSEPGWPIKYSIPAVLGFALLAALAHRLWHMLAKYLRISDTEELILDLLARSRGPSGLSMRRALRIALRISGGTWVVLLTSLYIRESLLPVYALLPHYLSSPVAFTAVITALILLPFSMGKSLATPRVLFASWTGVVSYVLWFAVSFIEYNRSSLDPTILPSPLWNGLNTSAFAFSASFPLSIYASIKAPLPHNTTPYVSRQMQQQKSSSGSWSRSRSFTLSSWLSIGIAVALTLPLVWISATPHSAETSGAAPSHLFLVLRFLTLVMSIPSILVSAPTLPLPDGSRFIDQWRNSVSKCLLLLASAILSLLPAKAWMTLKAIILVLAIMTSFWLPALLHVTTHSFQSPLSIILSPSLPRRPMDLEGTGVGEGRIENADLQLLQRKEQAMQRRQLRRRLAYDLLAWSILLAGVAWAIYVVVKKSMGIPV